MKMQLYSVYDTVAELFNKPFTDINDAVAKRNFAESVKDKPYKNDMVLYSLADFNDSSGEIRKCESPVKLMTGFEVKNSASEIPSMLKTQNPVTSDED